MLMVHPGLKPLSPASRCGAFSPMSNRSSAEITPYLSHCVNCPRFIGLNGPPEGSSLGAGQECSRSSPMMVKATTVNDM